MKALNSLSRVWTNKNNYCSFFYREKKLKHFIVNFPRGELWSLYFSLSSLKLIKNYKLKYESLKFWEFLYEIAQNITNIQLSNSNEFTYCCKWNHRMFWNFHRLSAMFSLKLQLNIINKLSEKCWNFAIHFPIKTCWKLTTSMCIPVFN